MTAAERAADAGGSLGLGPELAQRLLEELIYERVRTHVDLLQLGWFETDLDLAIRRVVDDLAGSTGDGEPPPEVLAASLMDRAWQRVVGEWETMRNAGPAECPVCTQVLAVDPIDAPVDAPVDAPIDVPIEVVDASTRAGEARRPYRAVRTPPRRATRRNRRR